MVRARRVIISEADKQDNEYGFAGDQHDGGRNTYKTTTSDGENWNNEIQNTDKTWKKERKTEYWQDNDNGFRGKLKQQRTKYWQDTRNGPVEENPIIEWTEYLQRIHKGFKDDWDNKNRNTETQITTPYYRNENVLNAYDIYLFENKYLEGEIYSFSVQVLSWNMAKMTLFPSIYPSSWDWECASNQTVPFSNTPWTTPLP